MSGARDAQVCVLLSPHPDDAVFSAWHVLTAPWDVRVVTVFAGVPEPGFVTILDRERGATDSAAIFRRRLVEDRDALAVAGRVPAQALLLEASYRARAYPRIAAAIERDRASFLSIIAREPDLRLEPEELARSLDGLADGDVVYAPAGIGGHADHRDVGRYAVDRLAGGGRRLRLYADFPYVVRHGPPSFLTGRKNEAADAAVAEAFAALGLSATELKPHVVRLSDEQLAAKLEAASRYQTEFELVDADFGGALSDRKAMRSEIYWASGGA
jgi:LmbE family N-acetylglucosaminyl deacetylase